MNQHNLRLSTYLGCFLVVLTSCGCADPNSANASVGVTETTSTESSPVATSKTTHTVQTNTGFTVPVGGIIRSLSDQSSDSSTTLPDVPVEPEAPIPDVPDFGDAAGAAADGGDGILEALAGMFGA
jgi:hypothetical protein